MPVTDVEREVHLLTELTRQQGREAKVLKVELERLRTELAKSRKNETSRASVGVQTVAVVDKVRENEKEEIQLLRKQSSVDTEAIDRLSREVQREAHARDRAEKGAICCQEEVVRLQRELMAAEAVLEKQRNRLQKSEGDVDNLAKELRGAKETLREDDWRHFWERKARRDLAFGTDNNGSHDPSSNGTASKSLTTACICISAVIAAAAAARDFGTMLPGVLQQKVDPALVAAWPQAAAARRPGSVLLEHGVLQVQGVLQQKAEPVLVPATTFAATAKSSVSAPMHVVWQKKAERVFVAASGSEDAEEVPLVEPSTAFHTVRQLRVQKQLQYSTLT
ncbi:hypothetical protein DIPPA_03175 [Diplonema papillatum]|nr:hypothetical protein DIPPA_03175 [Diplonema papillatum]